MKDSRTNQNNVKNSSVSASATLVTNESAVSSPENALLHITVASNSSCSKQNKNYSLNFGLAELNATSSTGGLRNDGCSTSHKCPVEDQPQLGISTSNFPDFQSYTVGLSTNAPLTMSLPDLVLDTAGHMQHTWKMKVILTPAGSVHSANSSGIGSRSPDMIGRRVMHSNSVAEGTNGDELPTSQVPGDDHIFIKPLPILHKELLHEPVIHLIKWTIVYKLKNFFICGTNTRTLLRWSSRPLSMYIRVDSKWLKSVQGGRNIELVCDLYDHKEMPIKNLPDFVRTAFCKGFPEDWRMLLNRWHLNLDKDYSSVDGNLSYSMQFLSSTDDSSFTDRRVQQWITPSMTVQGSSVEQTRATEVEVQHFTHNRNENSRNSLLQDHDKVIQTCGMELSTNGLMHLKGIEGIRKLEKRSVMPSIITRSATHDNSDCVSVLSQESKLTDETEASNITACSEQTALSTSVCSYVARTFLPSSSGILMVTPKMLANWVPMIKKNSDRWQLFLKGDISTADGKVTEGDCILGPVRFRSASGILSVDGEKYALKGTLEDRGHSIPAEIKSSFLNGVPQHWSSIVEKWRALNEQNTETVPPRRNVTPIYYGEETDSDSEATLHSSENDSDDSLHADTPSRTVLRIDQKEEVTKERQDRNESRAAKCSMETKRKRVLTAWTVTLIQVKGVWGLALEGRLAGPARCTARRHTSAMLTRRLDNYTMETADFIYILKGGILSVKNPHSRIPYTIKRFFARGFAVNWQQRISLWVDLVNAVPIRAPATSSRPERKRGRNPPGPRIATAKTSSKPSKLMSNRKKGQKRMGRIKTCPPALVEGSFKSTKTGYRDCQSVQGSSIRVSLRGRVLKPSQPYWLCTNFRDNCESPATLREPVVFHFTSDSEHSEPGAYKMVTKGNKNISNKLSRIAKYKTGIKRQPTVYLESDDSENISKSTQLISSACNKIAKCRPLNKGKRIMDSEGKENIKKDAQSIPERCNLIGIKRKFLEDSDTENPYKVNRKPAKKALKKIATKKNGIVVQSSSDLEHMATKQESQGFKNQGKDSPSQEPFKASTQRRGRDKDAPSEEPFKSSAQCRRRDKDAPSEEPFKPSVQHRGRDKNAPSEEPFKPSVQRSGRAKDAPSKEPFKASAQRRGRNKDASSQEQFKVSTQRRGRDKDAPLQKPLKVSTQRRGRDKGAPSQKLLKVSSQPSGAASSPKKPSQKELCTESGTNKQGATAMGITALEDALANGDQTTKCAYDAKRTQALAVLSKLAGKKKLSLKQLREQQDAMQDLQCILPQPDPFDDPANHDLFGETVEGGIPNITNWLSTSPTSRTPLHSRQNTPVAFYVGCLTNESVTPTPATTPTSGAPLALRHRNEVLRYHQERLREVQEWKPTKQSRSNTTRPHRPAKSNFKLLHQQLSNAVKEIVPQSTDSDFSFKDKEFTDSEDEDSV